MNPGRGNLCGLVRELAREALLFVAPAIAAVAPAWACGRLDYHAWTWIEEAPGWRCSSCGRGL